MKQLIKLVYIAIAALIIMGVSGCQRTEQDLFDESAAIRTHKSIAEIYDHLMSAENGWILDYIPNDDSSGATYLVKFISPKEVTMASQNKYVGDYAEADGYWRIISDMGPVLTFDTYNDIFHIFADPVDPSTGEADGVGLGGDYEFLIVKMDENSVSLKGKKHGSQTTLRKLEAGKDWEEYFSDLQELNNAIFGNSLVNLRLNVDGVDLLTLKNGVSHIFNAIPMGGNEVDDVFEIPFMLTDYGIRLSTPYLVEDKQIQNFRLSDQLDELVCIEEGVDAKISAEPAAKIFWDIINARKQMLFSYNDESMGSDIKNSYTTVYNAFAATPVNLEYIAFTDDKDVGATLLIKASAGSRTADGKLGFLIEINEVNNEVSFVRNESKDDRNGKSYLDNYGARELADALVGDYSITTIGAPLSSSTFKFTNKNNPDKWFVLKNR